MDQKSAARLATLQKLGDCPACGARVKTHGALDGRFSAHFACGAIFDVAEGKPISVLNACPAPSNVAVDALNREAGEAA